MIAVSEFVDAEVGPFDIKPAIIPGKNPGQHHSTQAIYLTTMKRPAAPTAIRAQDIPIRIAIRMTVRLMPSA
jgi:hypothetical protein